MSFLEDMAGKEIGSMTNSSNPLVASVMQLINSQPGGLSGLVQRLGGLVSSWVGTGQNLPVAADQLEHVLGSERVRALAAQAGIPPEIASAHLAQLLPMIVDKLTPNGQLPATGSSLEAGLGMRKDLGKTGTDT